MADLIELASGEYPQDSELHALVIASATPPVEGSSIHDHKAGRLFFASLDEGHIAAMVKRAKVWADDRNILSVYLRRE
jgi:hypothetical protein